MSHTPEVVPGSRRPFTAVILAGGESRRMGRDKAFLDAGGQPLIERQIGVVRAAGASEVLISGRRDGDYRRLALRVLVDAEPGLGPLSGVVRGLEQAREDLVLVLAVDQPEVTPGFLGKLAADCTDGTGVVPSRDGCLEPVCAFYPRRSLGRAQARLQQRRLGLQDFARELVEAGMLRRLDLRPDDARFLLNWNEPGDWAGADGSRVPGPDS